jgi:hypothetical protein
MQNTVQNARRDSFVKKETSSRRRRPASAAPRGLFLALAAACLASSLAACGGKGGQDDPAVVIDPNDLSNKEVLTSLGLSLDESAPKTAKGDAVSGDVNPLGRLVTRFFGRYELFQAGASVDGRRYSVLDRDDSGGLGRMTAYSTTESGAEASWLDLPKKSVAGDMDGDGKDEIVTAIFNGTAKTISFKWSGPNGALHTVNLTGQDYMSNFGSRTWIFDDFFMRDFASGDFNDDGYCEFALSCMDTVLILDHELAVVGSFKIAGMGSNPIVRVEAGDLNGDSRADLVVAYGKNFNDSDKYCRYFIFAGGTGGLGIGVGESDPSARAVAADIVQGGTGRQFCSGEIAIADYDGDGLNEIVFAGLDRSDGRVEDTWAGGGAYMHPYAVAWDPYDEAQGLWRRTYPKSPDYDFGTVTNSSDCCHPLNFYVPRMAVGSFNGGKKQQVLVGDVILQVNESGEIGLFGSQPFQSHAQNSFRNMIYDLAAAGDVTGDGCADLVYMSLDVTPGWLGTGWSKPRQNRVNKIAIWGKNSMGVFSELHTYPLSSTDQFPTIALADVDADSLTVKYERHDMVFSEPKILAVLASPPYYPGVMDLGNSATSYSLTSEIDETNSGHLGFYVGAAVGVGAEWSDDVSGAAAGFSIKASVEAEFSWGWGKTAAVGTDLTYTVNAGYDQVIFTGFPIDVYVYKILAGPAAFIAKNGPNVTISIPRKPSTNSLELGAYNSTVKDAYKIPASVMNHKVGQPFSYYSKAEMQGLKAEGSGQGGWLFSNSTMPVPQGSGNTIINTWNSVVKTSTFDFDLTLGLDVEAKVGYAIFEYSGGIRGGYSYEFNQSEGTAVEGEIGCIPLLADWNEKRFNWGLMMIPKAFGDQKFSFVTYWVEEP